MDLLYAGNLEGFVIVSSDSDFTRLATRLRESGMTSQHATGSHTSTFSANSRRNPSRRHQTTRRRHCRYPTSSEVGSYLIKSQAAFDPRDYGHTKLGELVRGESYVDVKNVPGPTGLSQPWVRLKSTAA